MKRLQWALPRRWRWPHGRRGTLRLGGLAVVALVIGVALGVGIGGGRPTPRPPAVRVPIAEAPVIGRAPSALPKSQPAESDRGDDSRQTALTVPPPPAAGEPHRSAGEPPWLRYAVAAPPMSGKALVAIVIDDVGLDRKGTDEAIRLAAPLTLSFMTYASDLPRLTDEARAAGHELLLHVPMEALDARQDAGPNSLQIGLGRDEILRRLRWGLDRMSGYVGINNHMGSRFTSSAESMAPVIEEVKARGLLFLDSRTAASSIGDQMARQMGVPHAARDVFLDYELGASAVQARLAEVEQVAHHRGSAIAIGHPHEVTLAALATWLPSLAEKGLVLVPLSAVVRQRNVSG